MDRIEHFRRIYEAAAESEDGTRCMVAPHPKLQLEMQEAIKKIKADVAAQGLLASMQVAEPRHPGLNNGMIVPASEFPLGAAPSSIRNAALVAAPLRGAVRVIVVLVDFPDKKFDAAHNAAHFRNLFFSSGAATPSVRDYYQEVTDSKIDIQGAVVGPYTLPRTMAAYSNGKSGMGNVSPNARTMAHDAALLADPDVDFTPYDNHHTGYVDAFVIVHAGQGAEVTGSANDIWSHKWVVENGPIAVDAAKIYAYLTVPEDSRIGVCCHELGHLLFGFPDLYDTDYSSQGIGDWCLMSGGSWGGGGDKPTHPCAWCKENQGWVRVVAPTANGTASIPGVETGRVVWRLSKDGAPTSEYFLLENRRQLGFDASVPAEGLLIWHIDETIDDNTNEYHPKVALMQADGRNDLAKPASLGNQGGDAGDPYPGSTGNTKFDRSSTPNSNVYSGSTSGVAVESIGPSGSVMTATLLVTGPIPAPKPTLRTFATAAAVVETESPLRGLAERVEALEADMQAIKAPAVSVARNQLLPQGISGRQNGAR